MENQQESFPAKNQPSTIINQKHTSLTEQQYLQKINQEYEQTLNLFKPDMREKKQLLVVQTFDSLSKRLSDKQDLQFGERQQAILKLKLARYLQLNEIIDPNTLFDALIETPNFINNDKGSLHKLFEIHEQKTFQKIAEIRRQRAEITGQEDFNPYEALFTTKSGNYYLAKLLNMPHLEEESEYMKHCVGTSRSYLNRMKKGEIEILSFRRAPKFNPKTKKLEGDTPIMTIEYDLKTNVINQMKKQNDKYLKQNDPFFNDLVETLKNLRQTKTDAGNFRTFTKIATSELSEIKVKDYYFLTDKGEIHFRDINSDDDLFILKTGEMFITPETSKGDAVKIIKLLENIDVLPEEIATKKEEVTEKTKLWVGTFFPNFFQWLPEHIQHVYASFPEGKIRRETIKIGGKDAETLIKEMRKDNIDITDYAQNMLRNPDFTALKETEDITLIRLKVKDLGLPNETPTTQDIWGDPDKNTTGRIQELGLELCPAEVGPHYRLQYHNQLQGEWLYIGMKPIADRGGGPSVFLLARSGGGPWLHGYWTESTYEWVQSTS